MDLFIQITKHRVSRYLFSGVTATLINLGLIYFFTEFIGIYYLIAGIISFIISVIVSYILQKKLTFSDHGTEDTYKKFIIFITVAIMNLCANALLLYFFTDFLHIYYMFSAIFSNGLVALWSFFIYKKIFKQE